MTVQVTQDPVLQRYRAVLDALYGDRIARVVLFGSRARGDAGPARAACFHMAQAYIFEQTGRAAKTHHSAKTEFLRLVRDDERADHDLRRFLRSSYQFKSVADYVRRSEPGDIP